MSEVSSCTTLTISFEISDRDRIMHVASSAEIGSRSREAASFVNALASGSCIGVGAKGDVVAWGCVGNYVSHHDFVGALLPLFLTCWSARLISQYDQIILMFQYEQAYVVEAYEIGLKNIAGKTDPLALSDICVRGGRIRFPVWDAIERQTSCYSQIDDPLPPLDLDFEDDS